MEDVINQSFKISLGVLRLFGAYSYEKSPFLMKLCVLILYFQTGSFIILAFVDLLVQKHDNLTELNTSFIFLVEALSICIRTALFFKFSAKVKNCVNYFGQERFQPNDDEERRMIQNCVYICHRNSKIFVTVVVIAVFVSCLHTLFNNKKTLVVNIWLPFDVSSSFLTYYGSMFYVDSASLYLGLIGTSIDPLLGGLVHHATTQLAILKYNLRHFHKLDKINSGVKFETVFKILQRCVKHHNDILQFVAVFEDCFSWIIFSQIGASTLALCFCCIGITVVDVKSIDFLQFVLFYCVIAGQIVFYCFYGTLLFEESKSLNEAIYLGPWYISDVRTRKILIILMERAKRPIVITAGKIIGLTLATLTAVIKTSYSLIAVFKK